MGSRFRAAGAPPSSLLGGPVESSLWPHAAGSGFATADKSQAVLLGLVDFPTFLGGEPVELSAGDGKMPARLDAGSGPRRPGGRAIPLRPRASCPSSTGNGSGPPWTQLRR